MKIAIAGYGLEGTSNYEYFKSRGEVTIVDEREQVDGLPNGVPTILGSGAFEKLTDFDMVVRTAGLNPNKIFTQGKIWSATREFFEQCRTPVIGVTGSKGKGTTASLIASILRAAGKRVELVGNIGIPALDALERANEADVVVYELSSFQLWDLEKSPHVAVVLMIEPDHLDVHADMQEYVNAKANIARHQQATDRVVYKRDNAYSASIAAQSPAGQVPYQDIETAHVRDGAFWYGDVRLCDTTAIKLPGRHNLDNACAAIDAVWPWVSDGETIASGLAAFTGLPHRLKFVREVRGVSYYDDSIATTPGSAIAAMFAFEQPKVLILGGSYKGADFTELAQIAADQDVRQVLVIGDEADRLEAILFERGVMVRNLGTSVTMQQIVLAAQAAAQTGDVVVLSPACASFGMFKNYADRGEQFVAAVDALQ
jgi:UDP-N-acetylmuramoylalanine--D-glutamate ligase